MSFRESFVDAAWPQRGGGVVWESWIVEQCCFRRHAAQAGAIEHPDGTGSDYRTSHADAPLTEVDTTTNGCGVGEGIP